MRSIERLTPVNTLHTEIYVQLGTARGERRAISWRSERADRSRKSERSAL